MMTTHQWFAAALARFRNNIGRSVPRAPRTERRTREICQFELLQIVNRRV